MTAKRRVGLACILAGVGAAAVLATCAIVQPGRIDLWRVRMADTQQRLQAVVVSTEEPERLADLMISDLSDKGVDVDRALTASTTILLLETLRGTRSREEVVVSLARHHETAMGRFLAGHCALRIYGRVDALDPLLAAGAQLDSGLLSVTIGAPPVSLARVEIEQLRRERSFDAVVRRRFAEARFDAVRREWLASPP